MSQRQKTSLRGLKYTRNCDHTIYPNCTDAAHFSMKFTDCPIQRKHSKYIFIAVNLTFPRSDSLNYSCLVLLDIAEACLFQSMYEKKAFSWQSEFYL